MMRCLGVLAVGAAAAGTFSFFPQWTAARRNRPIVSPGLSGGIVATVNATGTISPTTVVIVGSQLSGQVVEILADHNSKVEAGQVVARLNSDQIRARLNAARADLEQMRALELVHDAQIERVRADTERARAAEAGAQASREQERGGTAALTGRVFVVGPEGKPQGVTVRIGATNGGATEVMAGLDAGREVARFPASVPPALGVEVSPIDVRDLSEIERSVAAFARSANGGLIREKKIACCSQRNAATSRGRHHARHPESIFWLTITRTPPHGWHKGGSPAPSGM